MADYTIDSIIPFDMVIDPEMGLMKLIEFEYRDNFFNIKALGIDELTQIYLRQRQMKNPLSIIIEDENVTIDTMNDLYHQFMEKRYDDILKLSPNTGLFHLLQISYRNESVRFTLVCDNEEQEELFVKRGGKAHRIYIGSIFDDEILNINPNMYIKYVEQLEMQEKDIEGKNIYFADLAFNKIETSRGTIPSFLPQNVDRFIQNTFQFIGLYPINKKRLEKICGSKVNFENESKNDIEEEEE